MSRDLGSLRQAAFRTCAALLMPLCLLCLVPGSEPIGALSAQVEYTPTIRLKTADGRVLEYEGNRSLDDLLHWIRSNVKSGRTRTTYGAPPEAGAHPCGSGVVGSVKRLCV